MTNNFGKYDYSQVITEKDLDRLREGFMLLLADKGNCCQEHKFQYVVSIGIMDTLKKWLNEGKPSYIKGEFNENTGKFE